MKYAIGVDIGGTSIKYSLVGEDGSIRKKEAIRIDKKITGEETISRLGRALNDYIASLGVKVDGIGVGCPGAINSTIGTCDYSSNLHKFCKELVNEGMNTILTTLYKRNLR